MLNKKQGVPAPNSQAKCDSQLLPQVRKVQISIQ